MPPPSSDAIVWDSPFMWDETVASCFPDMRKRSIPGYMALWDTISTIRSTMHASIDILDLGCSVGPPKTTWVHTHKYDDYTGIDSSPAMIGKFGGGPRRRAIPDDIRNIRTAEWGQPAMEAGSLTLALFTLQFLPYSDRGPVLDGVRARMDTESVFIVAEKTNCEHSSDLTRLLHAHKRLQGYGPKQISSKDAALRDVMTPISPGLCESTLRAAGFSAVRVWQSLQFNAWMCRPR